MSKGKESAPLWGCELKYMVGNEKRWFGVVSPLAGL